MLDTVKFLIPLTKHQHAKFQALVAESDRWQWVLHNPKTGDLLFRRVSGLVHTDGESYHRQIRWDIPPEWSPDASLVIEFSLPKAHYGHNIRLLYDVLKPIDAIKRNLEQQAKLRGNHKLPDSLTWQLNRVDVCYAWNFHSDQRTAQQVLDSLKRHGFPYKKPVIRPESIFFPGNTYSVKLYLKQPEFFAHDRKELLKQNAALEWVEWLENISAGVLRFEATLRRKYLRRQNITTLGDLLVEQFHPIHSPAPLPEGEEGLVWIFAATAYYLNQKGIEIQSVMDNWQEILTGDDRGQHPIKEGMVLTTPPLEIEFQGKQFSYPGGELTFLRLNAATLIAQTLLTKLVGDTLAMQNSDQVKLTLAKHYKDVKAARLTSFWLYVQKFGSDDAKHFFGKDSFYYNRRELKKAGVSLVEPPKGNVINLDTFRFHIPNDYVVNKFDDFRDSENVLNILPMAK